MDKAIAERMRFGSQLHNFVLAALQRRRDFSQEKMRTRYETWRKADESFLSFIPEKDVDARRKDLRNKGEPQFTTVYIPYDYAVLMSAHTYWTSVFLSRSPVFQYQGTQGASQSSEQAIEALINYQFSTGKILPPFYVWLLDVGKYGVGIINGYWEQEKQIVTREIEVPEVFMDVETGVMKKEIRRVELPGYAGNKMFNVRPYDFLPDPRVPMNRLQEGEFCGRLTEIGWNTLAKASANGKYFNVDVVRQQRNNKTTQREWGSQASNRPFTTGEELYLASMDMGFHEIMEMEVELIPRDWGLDSTSYPEKWIFAVANDSVVIAAQPKGLFHNKFSYDVLELEPDAYSMFKRGMLDLARPMNEVINWLYNTHFYNTRKALNDMFVADPSMIVMKDLLDPRPGKIIRLKEEMYGQDVRKAISQLPVTNYTQAHLQDSQLIASLLQRVTGVNDNIMGMLAAGGRKTATEVRTSSTFGINRLKTMAEYMSATGIGDFAMKMLQNSQQLYSSQMKLRIAGEAWNTPGADKYMQVTPDMISGFYDYLPVDGTLPMDRFAQVNMWSQLLQQMAQSPQVMMQYDLGKIFGYVAQLGGIKNVSQFKIETAEMANLQSQAAAGNVVPLGGPSANRGSTRRNATGAGRTGGPPLPRQVAGMGPSG